MIERMKGGIPGEQSFTRFENEVNKVKEIQAQERQYKEAITKEPVTKEKLEDVVHGMNEFMSTSNTHLKFEFHDKLKEYYVTIVDDRTQEIVKEIPAKKMLDMHAAMTEFVGLLVDKKV